MGTSDFKSRHFESEIVLWAGTQGGLFRGPASSHRAISFAGLTDSLAYGSGIQEHSLAIRAGADTLPHVKGAP